MLRFAWMGRWTNSKIDVLLSWASESTIVYNYLSFGVSVLCLLRVWTHNKCTLANTATMILSLADFSKTYEMPHLSFACVLCTPSDSLCSTFENTFETTHSACFSLYDYSLASGGICESSIHIYMYIYSTCIYITHHIYIYIYTYKYVTLIHTYVYI